jgi:hypothetical protein
MDRVPVEVRMWLPDGSVVRLRSYLDELNITTDAGAIPYDLFRYIPVSKWYMLRMRGPAWKMNRGKPVDSGKGPDL